MTTLAAAVGASSVDELREARRLLHRAGQRARPARSVIEPGYPALFAGLCVELGDELVRRGDPFGLCPVCAAQVGRLLGTPATPAAV